MEALTAGGEAVPAPGRVGAAAPPLQPVVADSRVSLTAWEELWDATHRRYFYFNHETAGTQ